SHRSFCSSVPRVPKGLTNLPALLFPPHQLAVLDQGNFFRLPAVSYFGSATLRGAKNDNRNRSQRVFEVSRRGRSGLSIYIERATRTKPAHRQNKGFLLRSAFG